MKRRYEVVYYEYGLTKMMRKKFYTLFGALFFRVYVEYKYGRNTLAVVGEIEYD